MHHRQQALHQHNQRSNVPARHQPNHRSIASRRCINAILT